MIARSGDVLWKAKSTHRFRRGSTEAILLHGVEYMPGPGEEGFEEKRSLSEAISASFFPSSSSESFGSVGNSIPGGQGAASKLPTSGSGDGASSKSSSDGDGLRGAKISGTALSGSKALAEAISGGLFVEEASGGNGEPTGLGSCGFESGRWLGGVFFFSCPSLLRSASSIALNSENLLKRFGSWYGRRQSASARKTESAQDHNSNHITTIALRKPLSTLNRHPMRATQLREL